MGCDAVQPRIRPFLDDLLDEKDYREMHVHIEGCESCRKYASSVGTLSYRLYELGQVPLPPDMISAILYESEKSPRETPSSPAQPAPAAKKPFVWPVVLAVLVLAAVLGAGLMMQRGRKESPAPAASTSLVPAAPPALSSPDTEWHYHLSLASRPELMSLIRSTTFAIKSEAPNAVMVLVPKAALEDFESRLYALPGAVKEYGKTDASSVSGDAAQVSVYLE